MINQESEDLKARSNIVKSSYAISAFLILMVMVQNFALAGVDLISCQATDEAGKVYPVALVQSGHASNQYETILRDIKISIHQYDSFGPTGEVGERLPLISFRLEKPKDGILISAPGRAQVFPDGQGYVAGPLIKIGGQQISLECSKK